ncbi:molybdenum cofactor guanylyltransferase [Paenibacillus vulneris]|uniref:Molybdenum cofactor guanylyltransferase n=1 Tax=Paenibacillus vulneris TaxID=1133364 RepID=A0ABW3US87_9BACL|nr:MULTISPECIES: NTP transferase domain-containing protein [unclassified Paenibacillus]MBE1446988.1 molybdopterin-guanine dinucleotide biosynthesis protein A [Paenibacillus sp. OAS669]
MLSGVILAGGEKGVARSLRLVGGEAFIECQIREMQKVCQEIIVVTNEPRRLLPVVPRSIRILTDYYPGFGVLSGMHAAFALSKYDDLWVIGSHAPYVYSSSSILRLSETKQRQSVQAVLPVMEEKPEALGGVYSRSCLDVITELIRQEESGVIELLQRISWIGIKLTDWRIWDSYVPTNPNPCTN